MAQIKPLTEEERQKYTAEYAATLGVPANAFEIAAFLIRENKAYGSAMFFAFNLTKAYKDHTQFAIRAGKWFKEYINGGEENVTADWMYQAVVGYVQEVDPSYDGLTPINS